MGGFYYEKTLIFVCFERNIFPSDVTIPHSIAPECKSSLLFSRGQTQRRVAYPSAVIPWSDSTNDAITSPAGRRVWASSK
jgi:hypothetical protein